ncbi:MAG: amidohydrolase family protein [Gammaproteobacteria bacterium]|nr:amidohydrolase family protein [Gammaproteobacteria bacterium]
MREIDILIDRGTLVTMDPDRRIVTDGFIAVDDGRILEVGKSADLDGRYRPRKTIAATDRVVLPGFINGDSHVTGMLYRCFVPDDVNSYAMIYEWVFPMYEGFTAEDEYHATRLSCLEMLRTGTTTFAEGGSADDVESVARAVDETGMRAVLGRWCMDLVPGDSKFSMNTEQALQDIARHLDKFAALDHPRVAFHPMLLGIGTASDELILGALAMADDHGATMSMHRNEDEAEVMQSVEAVGSKPVEHLENIGALRSNLRLRHMALTSPEEIAALARHDVKVIADLTSYLRLAYGITRHGSFPEMLSEGICVSLGMDGATSSDFLDMGRAMHIAASLFKDCRMDGNLIPAEQALEMATVNGARSLGLEDQLGSLEPGKKADIVLFDRQRPEWVPMWDPVSTLVWSADGKSVDTVIVDGEMVLEGGEFVSLDEAEALSQAAAQAKACNERIGLPFKSRWPVV